MSNYLSLQDSPFFKNYVIKDEVLGDGSFSTCRWEFKRETYNHYSKLNSFSKSRFGNQGKITKWLLDIKYWALSIRPRLLVNFRQFPVVSGTAFSKNSKKGDILAWYIQIFESFFPKFSFFCSWNFQNVWLNVHISEIQLFSHFLEIFPGNFCIIHHRLPIPWNFSFYLETGEIILSVKQK